MGMRTISKISLLLWPATLALLQHLLLDCSDTTFQLLNFGIEMNQCGSSAQHQLLLIPLTLREALRRGIHSRPERRINGLHGLAEISD